LSGEDSSTPERLLLTMHNMGVVHEKSSKTIQELAEMTKISLERLIGILTDTEKHGYVYSFTDVEGSRRYYLTGLGIIRICSTYT
jgi:DNA-binding IscR family transcriptional regulator